MECKINQNAEIQEKYGVQLGFNGLLSSEGTVSSISKRCVW